MGGAVGRAVMGGMTTVQPMSQIADSFPRGRAPARPSGNARICDSLDRAEAEPRSLHALAKCGLTKSVYEKSSCSYCVTHSRIDFRCVEVHHHRITELSK